MCVAGNISSGLQLRVQGNKDLADQLLLHPRNKGYKGLADQALLQALFNQMLLRAHICVLQNTPKLSAGYNSQLTFPTTHMRVLAVTADLPNPPNPWPLRATLN